jgi:transposase-like protein
MAKRDPEREHRWRVRLEQWQASGQPAKQFCQERGLSVNALYSWRRELRRRDGLIQSSARKKARPADRFIQVQVEPAPACLELELGSAPVLRIPSSLDEEAMARVISAARKALAC